MSGENLCPLCQKPAETNIEGLRGLTSVNCERCGRYHLTPDAELALNGEDSIFSETELKQISMAIRKRTDHKKLTLLKVDDSNLPDRRPLLFITDPSESGSPK